MGKWPNLPIRTSLLLVVLAMALVSVIVISSTVFNQYENEINEAGLDAEGFAYSIGSEFRVLVNSAKGLGDSLALLPQVRERDRAGIEPLLSRLITQSPVYANIVMLDGNGKAWAAGVDLQGRTYSMADRKYFKEAMATGRFSSGEYAMGRTTGKPVMAFGSPVPGEGGKPAGCIAIGFNLEYFNNIFEKVLLPMNAEFILLDHRGTILYTPTTPTLHMGKPFPEEEFAAMRAAGGPTKAKIGLGLDGRKVIRAYTSLALNEADPPYLYVAVSRPYEEIYGQATARLARKLGLLLAAVGLSTMMVWRIARRNIVEPVDRIKEAIVEAAGGNLAVRIGGSLPEGELRKVGAAFDELVGSWEAEIDRRKSAEDALRISEARYRDLIEGTSNLVTVVDNLGRFVYVNRQAREVFGLEPEECVGRLAFDFVHPDDRALTMEAFREWLFTGVTQATFANRSVSLTGEVRDLEWTINFHREAGFFQASSIARDTTAAKRAEQEREKLQEQLRQSQKMEAVGRLAGGIAHDFNNMLSVIIGYSEMTLELLPPDETLHTNLSEIRSAALRSAQITSQLLAFARKQPIAPKVVDLNETLGPMLSIIKRLIGEDVDLVFEPEASLWKTKIDPSQLDQILTNLAANARDALAGVGTVTIATANAELGPDYVVTHPDFKPGQYVCLRVTDNGGGIPPEALQHIFDPFYTTKGGGEGTGLGLATVYGIVRQNGGFINVYSEKGIGTTFSIYLPRTEGSGSAGVKSEASSVRGGTETILLVEDEELGLRLLTTYLTKLGYSVLASSSPLDALEKYGKAEKIDLVITDVVMPGMNGRELVETLSARSPGLRYLYMSGYTADIIANRGVLEAGVNFIQKPYSLSAIGAKIREILEAEG